jgi:hypothetical protein
MRNRSSVAADLPEARAVSRWFHVWCLPTVWVIPIGILWCNAWCQGLYGDATGDILVAGFAGLWLAELLGQLLGLHKHIPQIVCVLAQCFGGMLAMGMVGAFQDFIHVPRRIVWFYLIAPLLTFVGLAILQGYLDEQRFLLRLFLLHFCIDLYAVSLLSCPLYLTLYARRKLLRRG